ncbi:putative low-specificity L-threonine aldolase [Smittium mucronatum]|uniref:Putative low-specificity L-threonine aldolase n=1 Tax=Smittium mucronatum TaxID=133383 RepID=A0A1R0GRB6_9FUNG|nr:putative low-specificity L-threonine aldolase [Smittium mucronatum]
MVYSYDFRSDTITKPTPEMLNAILVSEVGDDVYQEDPTVNKLESFIAQLTGKESALFMVSSTMSNQVGLRSHLISPPHSVICDDRAHIHRYEAGGLALISQATTYSIKPSNGVYLTAKDIESALIPEGDVHSSPTKVIELENTLGGAILPLSEMEKIKDLSDINGLKIHLDGARLWNVSVATKTPILEYCKYVDSVNLCLSKGLGSPIGAVLAGSREYINKARHYRKLLGGGWRQAGLLAAAAFVAIDTVWPKMEFDHRRAKRLRDGLAEMGISTALPVDTNIVMAKVGDVKLNVSLLGTECAKLGLLIRSVQSDVVRFVIHHQLDDQAIELLLQAFRTTIELQNSKVNTKATVY